MTIFNIDIIDEFFVTIIEVLYIFLICSIIQKEYN